MLYYEHNSHYIIAGVMFNFDNISNASLYQVRFRLCIVLLFRFVD